MVRLWLQDTSEGRFTMGSFVEASRDAIDRVRKEHLGSGKSQPVLMEGKLSELQFKTKTRHRPNDYFVVGMNLVISERLRAIFDEFQVQAEYFPLEIEHRKKKYDQVAFFVFNPLDFLDCLNYERSEYNLRESDDTITGFHTIVVDEQKAAGHPFFQLARTNNMILLASEELAERVQQSDVTGVKLLPPSEWKLRHGRKP